MTRQGRAGFGSCPLPMEVPAIPITDPTEEAMMGMDHQVRLIKPRNAFFLMFFER